MGGVAAIKKSPPEKALDPLRVALEEALAAKVAADAAVERQSRARSKLFADIRTMRARLTEAADTPDQSLADRAAELAAAALAGRGPAPQGDHKPKDTVADLEREIAAGELALERCKADAIALRDAVIDASVAVEGAIVAILEVHARPLIERASALRAELAPLVAAANELVVADIRQDLGFVPQLFGSSSLTKHDARSGSFRLLLDTAINVGHMPPMPLDGGRWLAARKALLADPFADIGGTLAI
jgi:hypothetical protein